MCPQTCMLHALSMLSVHRCVPSQLHVPRAGFPPCPTAQEEQEGGEGVPLGLRGRQCTAAEEEEEKEEGGNASRGCGHGAARGWVGWPRQCRTGKARCVCQGP